MTTLQKTFIAVTMIAAVGLSIYEAHEASMLRHQAQILQQQRASLLNEIQQLQRERNDTVKSGVNFTGILSDPNFRVVLRALQQRTDLETLAAPEVTTTSGRGIQGRFTYIDLNAISMAMATNPPPSSTIQRRTE